MEITFRISWRRSFNGAYCDQSTIESGGLIGISGNIQCHRGCSGTISDVRYRCTDFSIEEDWSFGERVVTYTFPGGTDITIAFSGGDWISPFDSSWRVPTTFSMVIRNDTGKINSTPRAITSPVLRIQEGCNHTIRVPVTDPDDDTVRCRWAVGNECAGICNGFSGAVLDPYTCSLAYYANQGQGFRAAALMIEDFQPGSTNPLSSVALQFLVLVVDTMRSCAVNPTFVSPTPHDGSCIAIPPGHTLHLRLVADSGYEGDTITEIQTVSPAGLIKTAVFPDSMANIFFVNITWSPTAEQENDIHLFCFTATNSGGLSTSQSCVQLLPGLSPPAPIPETASPNMVANVHPSNPSFGVEFNKQVQRTSFPAFITFHEFVTGVAVYHINASSETEMVFENSTEIILRPNYWFEEVTQYYITFDRGVVVGFEGCEPGNEPLADREFWTFTTRDLTPPIVRIIDGPSLSNANISVSWDSNEPVTYQCSLNNGLSSVMVNCFDAVWTGLNLTEGSYRLEISTTDLANNTALVSHLFKIDTTPPTLIFTVIPRTVSNIRRDLLRFKCEDNEACTFHCIFSEGNISSDAGLSSTCAYSFSTPFLSHGRFYTLRVVPTDEAGNVGESVSYTWETDFEPPTVFGVTNISTLCTGDLSPAQTGQAQARDNRDPAPTISFHDRQMPCSIARIWRAVDIAGNNGVFTQHITLEYVLALNFVPVVSVSCDSSTGSVTVPSNTATLPNPCRRPLQLSFEDLYTSYTCPMTFTRVWTLSDTCNQELLVFEQKISLFDICPENSCGGTETPPHGICVQGSCVCSRPWFGEQCETLIHSVTVEKVESTVLKEFEDYTQMLTVVNGTPPFLFSLLSSPEGMILNHETQTLSWRRVQAGNYTITVEVENEVSSERMSWSLIVRSGYTAVLDPVTQNLYPRATSIQLTGRLEYFKENVIEDLLQGIVKVFIEISSPNGLRELETFSRGDGTFSAFFSPAHTEYGFYVAGARHPRALRAPNQTSWAVLGMSTSPQYVHLQDATVAEFEKTFYNVSHIINDGPQPLNNITIVSSLENTGLLSITPNFSGPTTLQQGEVAYIHIQVRAVSALHTSFSIIICSGEGVKREVFVTLFMAQILPKLEIIPSVVNPRVVRGTARSLAFNVTNVGSIAAHMVRAVLPTRAFISLVNFGTVNEQNEGELTLDSGESATLTVLVTIPPEEPLGEISGRIVVSAVETFETIHFRVFISSDMLMNLTVVVEDEYSYFAEGRPLLSGAVVTLTNNQRGIREVLTTGESGMVTFMNIHEDRYNLRVTGPNHVPVDSIILTSAEEPLHTVFLPRRAVTSSFTVERTTFEETYTVTLEADFVTHVPIPVVTITPTVVSLEPYELGLEDTIQYNITNHGLIRADDVNFQLPTGHPFLEFSTEVQNLGSLDALSSIIVPVHVTRVESGEKRNIVSCVRALFYAIRVAYSYICGDLQHRSATGVLRGFEQFADCDVSVGDGGGGGQRIRGGGTFELLGPPLHPADPTSVSNTYTPTEIHCEKCVSSLLGCSPIPLGPSKCQCIRIRTTNNKIKKCFRVFFDPEFNFRDLVDWFDFIGCVLPLPQTRALSILFCLPAVFRDCLGADTTIGRRRRSIANTARDTVPYYYAMHQFTLLGVEILGDDRWLTLVSDQAWLSEVLHPALSDSSGVGLLISVEEFFNITSVPPPRNATKRMVEALLERYNNTVVGWSNGTLEPQNSANMASYSVAQNLSRNIRIAQEQMDLEEGESFLTSYNNIDEQYRMALGSDEDEGGICAVVRIRIEQEIALTRDAFLARLEIENMKVSDLHEIWMNFHITDVTSGVEATLFFVIGNETLTGSLTYGDGGWILGSGKSGAAEWLVVPLSEAAPTENRNYDIGGSFSYVSNGDNVTVPLLPTRITVAPDPSLIIHYFWEKFVIGDNPFTEEREPSVPFVLGVAIHNAGYGTAMNLRITSGQPEIIENDKGLLVTFKIIGTRIGSESVTPSLTVNFGDIEAMETKIARWLLISSLQGEFTNYSASFEYMNPLGDPRLSVLDELVIHDLIRNVIVYQEDEDDGVLDFLVNDISDLFDIPDALYSSKTFTKYNVSEGEIQSLIPQDSGVIHALAASNYSGWVYFRFEDVDGLFSENKRSVNFTKFIGGEVTQPPAENAWVAGEAQPSPGAADPYYLHIIDYLDEVGEVVYILNPCVADCATDEQEFEPVAPPGKTNLLVNQIYSSFFPSCIGSSSSDQCCS